MTGFALPLDTEAMEAKSAQNLPEGEGWQFEPKWDGFRCIAYKGGGTVELRAKSGKSLSRYFPEILISLHDAPADDFVIDGELAIPRGASLSFAALQDRIHPAESRVLKLAVDTPAVLILFDCLAAGRVGNLISAPLTERRSALEKVCEGLGQVARTRLSPFSRDRAEAVRWLADTRGALDGVVAKRLDAPYTPGKRTMVKVKRLRTADCVVGGFRYETGSRQVGSLLLGLYNPEGNLDHVGFTSAISDAERPSLTRKVEALRGGAGFTGEAPGGPSRWATARSSEWESLEPKLVAEVRYDHVSAGRFRHGTMFLRWRPDKAPGQCTADQLKDGTEPGQLVRKTLRAQGP